MPKDELEISVYMQQSQTHRLAQQYSGILEVGKEEQWIRNGTPIGTEACEAKEVCQVVLSRGGVHHCDSKAL